jgi:hypothetical protein
MDPLDPFPFFPRKNHDKGCCICQGQSWRYIIAYVRRISPVSAIIIRTQGRLSSICRRIDYAADSVPRPRKLRCMVPTPISSMINGFEEDLLSSESLILLHWRIKSNYLRQDNGDNLGRRTWWFAPNIASWHSALVAAYHGQLHILELCYPIRQTH